MQNQTNSRRAIVVTADERIARLYEARPTQGKALDLKEVATLANRHENEHERGRPDMMSGPGIRSAAGGSGVAGGPHLATPTETGKEESRRFAREVAAWLADRPERANGKTLNVFAASRFLGVLRDELDGSKTNHIELTQGELAQMPVNELRTHSALLGALSLR